MAIIVPVQRIMTFQRFFGLVSITSGTQSEGNYTLSASYRRIGVKMGVKNYMKGSNTMNLKPIEFSELVINPQDLIDRQALVLTSGNFATHAFKKYSRA